MTLTPQVFTGWKVAVIDDDPNSLHVAQLLLEFKGAIVSPAQNGQQGLEVIRAIKPDLILSDISMPVLDGWQLIKILKADEELKDIPVIALTAHAMKGDQERVLKAGFQYYISKPLIPSTFASELFKALQHKQKADQ